MISYDGNAPKGNEALKDVEGVDSDEWVSDLSNTHLYAMYILVSNLIFVFSHNQES